MIYCFDIDGTVCETEGLDYKEARPIESVVDSINALYEDGHTILMYTARGMGTLKGDLEKVYSTWYEVTKNQLNKWGVKHHQLILGKPAADFYIDDKAVNALDWREKNTGTG